MDERCCADPGGGASWLRRTSRVTAVRAAVGQLRHGSSILENLVREGRLEVIGAEYDLETGRVAFDDV